MSKIAFIQGLHIPNLGIMYLSSFLKFKGHQSKVFLGSYKNILENLEEFCPDIIAFSCMSGEKSWLYSTVKVIKENYSGFEKTMVVVGGPLATFTPEIVENPYIDMACRGEGELVIAEIADKVSKNRECKEIKNTWVKYDNKIYKNNLRPLIQNLNKLPFPDRSIYKNYPFIMNDPNFLVLTMRGCPYSCSYCIHEPLRKLYSVTNKCYLRQRSVENVIEELKKAKQEFNLQTIWIIDDTFFLDKNWTKEFLRRYKSEVKLPFKCSVRIDNLDRERIELLKQSNYCHSVCFGIETGSDKYRKEVLNKNITNEQIIKKSNLLKRYGMEISTTNMIALPGETVNNALSTINLNKEISPSSGVCTIYKPHPGTELYDYVLKNSFFKKSDVENMPSFTHSQSFLRQENKNRLVNLHKFFYALVFMPHFFPLKLIRILIKLPYNIFYFFFYCIGYVYFYMRRLYKINLYRALQEIIVALRYYVTRW